jgi:DMSO/TMAO reductase YedYZ molybdopterin-dependent catalytic subunit
MATLLVDAIDGKPFPDAQGPLRIIVPKGKIGARWVRQVEQLEVRTK